MCCVFVYLLIKFALHIPLPYSTERGFVLGLGDKKHALFLKLPFRLVQYCTFYMFKCHDIDADNEDDDDAVIVVFIVAYVA